MPFDPVEFFHLSERLVKELDDSEVILRTGISRAYYAAFLSARAKTPMNVIASIAVKISDVHWAVRVAMKKMHHPEIADKLQTLATFRHTSDYDMGGIVGRDSFDSSLILAEDVLNLLGGLP